MLRVLVAGVATLALTVAPQASGAIQSQTTVPTGATGSTPILGSMGVVAGAVAPESWCRVVLPESARSPAKAAQIMAGRVDLGMYGWFPIKAPPTWLPSNTLDASGNTHMHGLHWATPLLYEGLATANPDMVARFYAILGSWLATFPPEGPRTSTQDQPIIAGERLWTLTCAAELAAVAGVDPVVWATAAQTEAERQLGRFRIARGTNNTAIHAQGGAFAEFCRAGDRPRATRALANLSALADYLVLSDGSDREGSPHYAYYTYRLLRSTATVAEKCGMEHPTLDAALLRSSDFLAHSTRPDGILETLGDSPGSRMNPALLPSESTAQFAASLGAAGVKPDKVYASFLGGYVFGRSSWAAKSDKRRTFYSVRTGRGPAPTAHTHSDIGSITVNAKGVEWIGDPGPWRYDRSPLRSAIVQRAAHSAVTVKPLPPRPAPRPSPTTSGPPGPTQSPSATASGSAKAPTAPAAGSPTPSVSPSRTTAWTPPAASPRSRLTRTQSDSRQDVTCIDDLTYPTTRITRCVTFRRDTGTVTVEDRIKALARSEVTTRWQIPNGVKVARSGKKAALRSSGKRADLVLSGSPAGRIRSTKAWFTIRYGVKAPGTTISRTLVLEKGQSAVWRMTLTVK